jgi:hypothetical protein
MVFKKNHCLCQRWGVKFWCNDYVLIVVVNCVFFGLEESFQSTCFGHAFSKACEYNTIEEKVCKDLKYVSIKYA